MYFSKDEQVELNFCDLHCTFDDMVYLIDDLTEKLTDVIDIIEKINDIVEEATVTSPAMDNFSIRWEDIRKIIDFVDTYGKNSEYGNKVYENEKIADDMLRVIQEKILNKNN